MNRKFILAKLLCCIGLIGPVITKAQVSAIKTETIKGGNLIGRWNIKVNQNGADNPSWLEVELSGFSTLVGRFVSTGGSARPISKITFDDEKFSFSIPPQWEKESRDLSLEGTVNNTGIRGTIHTSTGQTYPFSGVKAPDLKRTTAPVWGKAIKLFNGKDLSGWKAIGKNQWIVKDGVLSSPQSGSNLISEQKFSDFKLHVEFRYQPGSNSGVYLRGRYETQIIDNPKTDHPNSHLFGGIYGFLVPNKMAVGDPGQWQTFDITLVGRMVTVVANGKTIICNQEIPGITGGALDGNEAEPGPIYFQGDHGPIEFRNIVIIPAK